MGQESKHGVIGEDGFLIRQHEQKNDVKDHKLFKRDATPRDHKYAIQYVKKGIKHYNVKNYPKAVEYFTTALKHDDAYARAYYYLGNAYYKLRRMTDALCNWQLAVDADPESDSAEKARGKMQGLVNEKFTVEVVKQPYH